MGSMKFIHKTTGRIEDFPPHFATAKIAKNFEPLVEEIEEEKVVFSHTANSQLRVGKKAKEQVEETSNDEDND